MGAFAGSGSEEQVEGAGSELSPQLPLDGCSLRIALAVHLWCVAVDALAMAANHAGAVAVATFCRAVSTVQKWEIGEKKPSGPSLKLLNVIDQKGVDALV